MALLNSPVADVRDQATWALGNIAGDSAEMRDLLLGFGPLNILINLVREVFRYSFFLISNLTIL